MTLRASVLLTTAYSAQFSYPLTVRELWLRLLCYKTVVSTKPFLAAVRELIALGVFGFDEQYIFLSQQASIGALRTKSAKRAIQKREELVAAIRLFRLIPWITGVAVTGSVAVGQAREQDDLDFLVVTKPHSLWLSRILLVGLSLLLRKYRSRTNAHTSGWCFNMWLETSELAVAEHKRSVYTAYEVLQADWIFEREPIGRQFLIANTWVQKLIPHGFNHALYQRKSKHFTTSLASFVLYFLSPATALTNAFLYFLQTGYMSGAKTREIVRFSVAFFHPRNTHANILSGWKRSLEQL